MAAKIMLKNYTLTNTVTGDKMTVRPESIFCGLNQDNKKDRDKEGRRIRVFSVVDAMGVDHSAFETADNLTDKQFVVRQTPGKLESAIVVNGESWDLSVIAGERAKKTRRTKAAKASQTSTPNASVKPVTNDDVQDTVSITDAAYDAEAEEAEAKDKEVEA